MRIWETHPKHSRDISRKKELKKLDKIGWPTSAFWF
jgi:hypothetical protein